MARSLLSSFVSGTRQMLAVQLFVSVGAVALAGYTFGVTNNIIRERDQLNERVIQLEEALAQQGVMPPAPAPVRATNATAGYPSAPVTEEVVVDDSVTEATPEETPAVEPEAPTPTAEPTPDQPRAEEPTAQPPEPTPQAQNPSLDLAAQALRDLLTPPPPLRTLVLHVRSRTDYDNAQVIARQLADANVRISVAIMEPNDQTATGYAYYHGRQSRPAAELAQRVQDAARAAQIAPWAVQLRGTALPAQGDYTADRVDVVLPALPAAQNPSILRVNPQVLQDRLRVRPQPPVRQQPQPDPNAPR